MARPGTAKAKELLLEIARKHNTDPKSVIEGGRWQEYIVVKQEFCKAVKDSGISMGVAAEILRLDHSTAVYHSNAALRERKKQTRTRGNSDAQDQDHA